MSADFLIVGGGVVGLRIAIELKQRYPDCGVVLIEKEDSLGFHASGRNSGVLHAGFYYSADSLKARFCREGNAFMRAYCEEYGLKINACGKLVVAKDESELAGLDELYRRGTINGVVLQSITAEEARAIEPRVKTFERALFSPTTATIDPAEMMSAFEREAERLGVLIRTGTRYLGRKGDTVQTNKGAIQAGFVVNSAGLYADVVARDYGFSEKYTVLPFKGLYLYSSEPKGSLRTNIYPVPDLKNPFLGVHFTVTVDGKAKIGPTAIPAFWREHYTGLERFSAAEFKEVVSLEASLFLKAGFDFRGLAQAEIKKYSRPYLVNLASTLAEGIRESDYTHWGKPGIRAQLLDIEKRTLVMDFLIENDEKSLHLLNTVSPGWTCSMPFAQYVCDKIAG